MKCFIYFASEYDNGIVLADTQEEAKDLLEDNSITSADLTEVNLTKKQVVDIS